MPAGDFIIGGLELISEIGRLGGEVEDLLRILGVSKRSLPKAAFDSLEDLMASMGRNVGTPKTYKRLPPNAAKVFRSLAIAGRPADKEFEQRLINATKADAAQSISTKQGVLGAVQLDRVVSSNVFAIGYDKETGTLRVQFNRHIRPGKGGKFVSIGNIGTQAPGAVYDYYDVPPRKWTAFQQAGSKGKWVWDNLRVRGTISGARYDYRLVFGIDFGVNVSGKRKVYIPRLSYDGKFKRRVRVVGGKTFTSQLPNETVRSGERGERFRRGK